MSHMLNTASKVHDAQLKAAETFATTITGVADKAASTVGQVGQNAPEVPSFLAGPVGQVKEAVESIFGSHAEAVDYVKKAGDDWAAVGENLRSGLTKAFSA